MDAARRSPSDPVALLRALAEDPYRHDFYRALRLIECAYPDRPRIGEARRLRDEPVRFGQNPSLAFAPAALAGFDPGAEGRAPRLAVAFFGLMGPNGPLPLHLTEYAHQRQLHQGDPTLARFLDVFHHRLLSIFYRIWARAQPTVAADRPDRDRFRLYAGSLIGVGFGALARRDAVPDAAKLAHIGLLARDSRNAAGLESILSGYFGVPVRIEQFVAHWLPLPGHSLTRVARAGVAELGRSAVIGDHAWDLQSRFRIVVGPLSLAQYERFLPCGGSFARLVDWVRTYVGFELAWDCRLVLKKKEAPPLILGLTGRLGWTSWLGARLEDRDAEDLTLQPRAA